jgi:hypothetical protein
MMLVVWGVLVGAGFFLLTGYSLTPGAEGRMFSSWPGGTHLRQEGRAALILFAHPQCACTRATLGELARLVARLRDRLTIYVLFADPAGSLPQELERTELWQSAISIPHTRVLRDAGGTEARLFGATTSGQTYLFDTHGRLRYRGGITASRGHSGDSPGRSAILRIVEDGANGEPALSGPAFGCALQTPGDRKSDEPAY